MNKKWTEKNGKMSYELRSTSKNRETEKWKWIQNVKWTIERMLSLK